MNAHNNGTPSYQQLPPQRPGFYASLALVLELLYVLLRMMLTYVEMLFALIFPPKEKSVVGDIVLITGTGHGIGKELARQYGELGAIVVCVDVNAETNNETVSELRKSGIRAYGYMCDVADREKVLELKNKVTAEVGVVSILINNAGIMPCQPLPLQSPEVIKKQFDINVFAHFWTLEAFLPTMTARGRGHVVALSSVAGLAGQANLAPYCATKFAVRGLMESLHEEHRKSGSQVKFTTIYPYMTDTGLCKKPRIRFPEFFKLLPPSDVAAAIISAQRREYREVSVPSYMLYLNNKIRSLPGAAAIHFIDFIDSGLDPHD